MSLSTMQEIFVLLEDEKQVPLYRINRWGRPARGALAKLKSLGHIEKIEGLKEVHYAITTKGEKYFDKILSILKEEKSWDKKWRLVMFEIPENKRSDRDKLRRALENLGMGLLQSSVWFCAKDIKNEVEALQEKYQKIGTIRYFEVSSSPSFDRQIVEKIWNVPQNEVLLQRFIKDGTWALKGLGRGNSDRFEAKKLVYEYALILNQDPKLPLQFIEQSPLRENAREIYLKLRKYIV